VALAVGFGVTKGVSDEVTLGDRPPAVGTDTPPAAEPGSAEWGMPVPPGGPQLR
jgi:hypothetical protein